jgi:hypothetical protein
VADRSQEKQTDRDIGYTDKPEKEKSQAITTQAVFGIETELIEYYSRIKPCEYDYTGNSRA